MSNFNGYCSILLFITVVGCQPEEGTRYNFRKPCVADDEKRIIVSEFYDRGPYYRGGWPLLTSSSDCNEGHACAVPYSVKERRKNRLLFGPDYLGNWPPPEGANGICVITCIQHEDCYNVMWEENEGIPGNDVCCKAANLGESMIDGQGACVNRTGEAMSTCSSWKIGGYLSGIGQ